MNLKSITDFLRRDKAFSVTVLVPTALAALYWGIFASDLYVSESRLVIRTPEKTAPSGLGALIQTAVFPNAGNEVYAVQSYVTSREALSALDSDNFIRNSFSNDQISLFDRFDPLGLNGSFEDLYDYYLKKVNIEHDSRSSITTLTVRAYNPRDAQVINRRLTEQAEALVNRLNARGRKDLIRFAVTEVDQAQRKAKASAVALAAFRNRSSLIDPEKQAAIQIQMISKLQDELIASEIQLSQTRSVAPENPQIVPLSARVAGLRAQIKEEQEKVAGPPGSLSSAAVEYQKLQLENEVAGRQLAAALNALEQARNDAQRKQAYVERIASPLLPDKAREPKRAKGVLATLLLGLAFWGILRLLIAGVKEHTDH